MGEFSNEFDQLVQDVSNSDDLESLVSGKGFSKKIRVRRRGGPLPTLTKSAPVNVVERAIKVVEVCRAERKRHAPEAARDLSDDVIHKAVRFCDVHALMPFRPFLHYVPRMVNVVTLAEAVPTKKSGLTLPLDLFSIASRCNGAFFASRRFAAVQLAFTHPRCRVLVFRERLTSNSPPPPSPTRRRLPAPTAAPADTGRLVGTGCNGTMSARLAVARAQSQLSHEAGIDLAIRKFSVINTVGAASLRATLECDAFAEAHLSEAHFDRSSFVGLAWRPPRENCCVEIYSTGRANLPGARRERDLVESFYRMLPELLRFSSSSRLLIHFPEHVQLLHKTTLASNDSQFSETAARITLSGGLDDELDDEALAALGL